MSELRIQSDICTTFWNKVPKYRGALYHINNNSRSVVSASQLIGAGLVAGIPDLCLAIPSGGYGALYIELKKESERTKIMKMLCCDAQGVDISPNDKHVISQMKAHARLRSFGNKVVICFNAEEALGAIKEYLNITF